MLFADVAQDGLVYRTGERELEVWVLPIAHIGEVLVRHSLDDCARDIGQARFRIVFVQKPALAPQTVLSLKVALCVGQQGFSKVARSHAGNAGVELPAV